MPFIKLTERDGQPVWVNVAKIVCFGPHYTNEFCRSRIQTTNLDAFIFCRESPEEILRAAGQSLSPIQRPQHEVSVPQNRKPSKVVSDNSKKPSHLNISQAVAYGIPSRAAVYRLLGDGLITAIKLGKRTLIDRESIDDYFATLPAAQISSVRSQKKEN